MSAIAARKNGHGLSGPLDLLKPWQTSSSNSNVSNRFPEILRSLNKSQVRRAERAETRKDRTELRAADAEPTGECSCVLHAADGGNPSAVRTGIVGTAERERGVGAVKLRSRTAPPSTMWWLPQPWSLPLLELGWNVREKSDMVKVVTWLAMPSSWVAW